MSEKATQALSDVIYDFLQEINLDSYGLKKSEHLDRSSSPIATKLTITIEADAAPLDVQKNKPVGEDTAGTARNAFYLWLKRRNVPQLCKGSEVAMLVEEVARDQQPIGDTDISVMPIQQRQHIQSELQLLAGCTIKGQCQLEMNGQSRQFNFNDRYLNLKVVSGKGTDVVGFLISPGPWMTTYQEALQSMDDNKAT